MMDRQALVDLHAKLGYRPLNRVWAKVEILLGLLAVGAGLLLGEWALTASITNIFWGTVAAGLVLFVLGGYLTLAGHRSHLYQSNNELIAYLTTILQDLHTRG